MAETSGGWQVFDAGFPILTYEYSFGPGTASALAVGCEGGLLVVSPPCKAAPAAFSALERFGEVSALVAPNAFHHLGLPEWRAHFPKAAVFAPAQSIARVQKQSGLSDIQPLANAAAIAGSRLTLIDMPHYKTGEALVRIDSERGRAWYVTDIIMNMQELPGNAIARFAFRISGSAPGLRFNNIAPLFMVADKAALRRWVVDEAAQRPPRWIIPAHGDIIDLEAEREAAARLFATR